MIWGTKGPLIKAYVHQNREDLNPIVINQSRNNQSQEGEILYEVTP